MRNWIAILATGCVFATYSLAQTERVANGTEITVRTNETIDARSPSDGRIYTGVIDRDVTDRSGHVVIPRGSNAELITRDVTKDTVVLDIESIDVNGRRYTVSTEDTAVPTDSGRKEGVGANKRTGKYVGGGAVLGTIIGAIAGGGKGAAIGAAAGAGAGAAGQTVTRGRNVRLPSETLVTFRLDRPLRIGTADSGYSRSGQHYHRNNTYNGNGNNQSIFRGDQTR